MKLYHGTSEEKIRKILKDGLQPKSTTLTKGNWEHTVGSNPDNVYLTSVYAPYFANCASAWEERWAIIEIDTDNLDTSLLRPDEDFLEQAVRNDKEQLGELGILCMTMKGRTQYFRDHIDEYANIWESSVDHLGTCGYKGTILPEQFSRVVLFNPLSNTPMSLGVCDPSITLLNYKFCVRKYEAITRWMLGKDVEPEEILGFGELKGKPLHAVRDKMIIEMVEQMRESLKQREIEVLLNKNPNIACPGFSDTAQAMFGEQNEEANDE